MKDCDDILKSFADKKEVYIFLLPVTVKNKYSCKPVTGIKTYFSSTTIYFYFFNGLLCYKLCLGGMLHKRMQTFEGPMRTSAIGGVGEVSPMQTHADRGGPKSYFSAQAYRLNLRRTFICSIYFFLAISFTILQSGSCSMWRRLLIV